MSGYHPWADQRATQPPGSPYVDHDHLNAVLGRQHLVDTARAQLNQTVQGQRAWAQDRESEAAFARSMAQRPQLPSTAPPGSFLPRRRFSAAYYQAVVAYGSTIAWSNANFNSPDAGIDEVRSREGITVYDEHAWAKATWVDSAGNRYSHADTPIMRLHRTSTGLLAFWFSYAPRQSTYDRDQLMNFTPKLVDYGCDHPGTHCQDVCVIKFDPVRIEPQPGWAISMDEGARRASIDLWALPSARAR